MSMLKVENLSVHYGMIQAVRDVSFEVNEGEVVSLIGANGAGKTTILRTISGLVRPSSGKIEFLGNEIQKVPAQKIVAAGLSQVPEGRHVFSGLTVLENLEMGAFLKTNRDENQANLKKVFSRFPRLEERKNQDAATLSGGEQQMLAMGRALMSTPKLLLLDEPFGALDVITRGEMQDWLLSVRKQMNRTVLLVTHDMDEAIYLSDRILVLDAKKGKVRQEFTVKEEKRNREWLYEQGALRREIYKEIMEGKVNV